MKAIIKNVLFTLIAPGTVGVYLPLLIAGDRAAASGFRFGVAVVMLAIGAAIYCWCLWDFATFGRGTPAPIDAPKRLVVRGLYRYSRNPMYVGVLTVILGWAVMYHTWWLVLYATGVATMFTMFIVLYEERALRRLFGEEYVAYCSRVRRWVGVRREVRSQQVD